MSPLLIHFIKRSEVGQSVSCVQFLRIIAFVGLFVVSALGPVRGLNAQTLGAQANNKAEAYPVGAPVLVAVGSGAAPVSRLAFGDFFQMPFGPQGLSFTPKALALKGQTVSMVGYMVKMEQPQVGAFILSPRPVEINDHADGEANDLPANAVWVFLDPAQAQSWVPHRSGLVQIQGRLDLGRQESSRAEVSWIRIQLGPEAVRIQDEPLVRTPMPGS